MVSINGVHSGVHQWGPSMGSAIGHPWGPPMGSIHGSINGAIIGVSNRASMGPPMGSIHESIYGVHPWGPPMGPIHGVHPWGPSVGRTSFDPDVVSEARRHAGQEARPVGRLHLVQIIPGAAQHLRRGDGVQDRPETPPHPPLPVPRSPTPEVPLTPPPNSPSLRCPPPVHRTLTMRCCGAGTTCSSSTSRVTCFRLVARDMAGRERPRAGAAPLPPQRAPSASGCVASLPPQGGRKGGYARIGCACPACRGRGAGTRSDWLCVPCVMSVGGGARL